MVLTLQEWRHWLEGSTLPFVVWTEHKTYLHSAKRLNCRQAQWALFLGHFESTLTYCTGSHNIKPDALSHQFSPDLSDPHSPPLLRRGSCELAGGGEGS